ncbi:hypothetical protein B0T24DRAFT_616476 [Lasiosphaeria ovina]|uniref:Mid2 domain-containing protein n=1 Tax=Lasiosphaeria ovina TaxID=92902 RepID=A0AAE0KF30_9PEZI|nr:hypothetical protein B0T24DRAFT_616476 [Lasiosphaeria ovina]
MGHAFCYAKHLPLGLIGIWIGLANCAATCYDYAGQVQPNIYPCNLDPGLPSPCCGSNDFCLSNGLCLDGGGNNGLTQQGCTSQAWMSPCVKHCPESNAGDGHVYLMMCSGFDGENKNALCCGTDYTCCNATQSLLTGIPKFSTLSRAAGLTMTTTSTTLSSSSTTSTTSSATQSATCAPVPESGGTNVPLVVGAAAGIPLGLALIGTLLFLGWHLSKRNRLREQAGAVPITPGSYSLPPHNPTQIPGQPMFQHQAYHAYPQEEMQSHGQPVAELQDATGVVELHTTPHLPTDHPSSGSPSYAKTLHL